MIKVSNELMELSKQITRIAESGKSGINLELNLDGYFLFELKYDGKKIKINKKPIETPNVASFSALGDEEGDDNIKEKLIKITNAFFDKDMLFDYFKSLIHSGDIKQGSYEIRLELNENPRKTIFNGGRRGYLTGGEDILFDDISYTLKFEDDVIEKGKCDVEVIFEKGIEKWYEETFKKYR